MRSESRQCWLCFVQVWERYGVEGIEKLRGKLTPGDLDGGFSSLMSLCWGAPNLNFKLDYKAAGAGSSVVAAAARAQEVSPAAQLPPCALRHARCGVSCASLVTRNAAAQSLVATSCWGVLPNIK